MATGQPARQRLVRLLARRLLTSAVLLFVVSALSFVLVSLAPGDAAYAILGRDATPETYVKLRAALGLDLPIYEQYWRWLSHALGGDLGTSLYSGQSVAGSIAERLPVTVTLMVGALLVSVVFGVSLGAVSAVRGGAVDRAIDAFTLVGFALPGFWVAAVLVSLLAVNVRLFPAIGFVPFDQSPLEWFRSLVLPVTAFALHGVASISKQTREAMLDVLGSEYVRVAWANGIRRRSIYLIHALKNAAVRVVTIVGLHAVGLAGGTVVVESIFGLPGLGSLALDATVRHDLPMAQGVVICFTLIVIAINLTVDLTYSWLDPRVRVE